MPPASSARQLAWRESLSSKTHCDSYALAWEVPHCPRCANHSLNLPVRLPFDILQRSRYWTVICCFHWIGLTSSVRTRIVFGAPSGKISHCSAWADRSTPLPLASYFRTDERPQARMKLPEPPYQDF